MQSPLDSFQFVCLCFGFLGSNSFRFLARLVLASLDEYVKVIIIFCTSRAERQTSRSTLGTRADPLTCQPSAIGTGAGELTTHSGAVAQWGLAQRLMAFALGLIATLKWFTLLWFCCLAAHRNISMSANFYSLVRANANTHLHTYTHTCTHTHTHTAKAALAFT